MTTATKQLAAAIARHPEPPQFPPGFEVKVDRWAGVLHATEPLPSWSDIKPIAWVVTDIRLKAETDEEWVQTGPAEDDGEYRHTITYPNGWEYQLARATSTSSVYGWVTEAELIER